MGMTAKELIFAIFIINMCARAALGSAEGPCASPLRVPPAGLTETGHTAALDPRGAGTSC